MFFWNSFGFSIIQIMLAVCEFKKKNSENSGSKSDHKSFVQNLLNSSPSVLGYSQGQEVLVLIYYSLFILLFKTSVDSHSYCFLCHIPPCIPVPRGIISRSRMCILSPGEDQAALEVPFPPKHPCFSKPHRHSLLSNL